MKITVNCDKCGKRLKAPESMAGKRAKCSQCGAIVTIPMPKDESDDTAFELQVIEEAPTKPKRSTPPPASKAPEPPVVKDRDTGPLDILEDLLEPELPVSALVHHDPKAEGASEKGINRGKGRGRGGPAAGETDEGMNAILDRAAENSKRRGPQDAPQPLFSLLGFDFTPARSIAMLVIICLLLGGSVWWFTGPGQNLRIFDAQPVTALVAMNSLARIENKGLAGMTLGQMGVKAQGSPLGNQFAEEVYGFGGPDSLIFTRPDDNGNYLLVHLKVSQRVVSEEHLENRYDTSFSANNFILHVGNEQIYPTLMMGRWPEKFMEFNTSNSKVDNAEQLLPADVTPDEYSDLTGTEASITQGTLLFNGKSGVTGSVRVQSSRKMYDQPGVSGVSGEGELVRTDPFSGMTLKYEYRKGDMRISWNGPATAWWSSPQYLMPAAVSPFARYDIYLLYPRPKSTGDMIIKLNNRIVGSLPASMAGKDGQGPSSIATAGVPQSAVNPTVNTNPSTTPTPDEAAAAMAGGAGGTGTGSGAGSKPANPGMFDYFGALARTRDMGKGIVAENNMKQLGMAVIMYAEQNKGNLPQTMDDLRKTMGDINKLLENVRTNSNPGYIYVPPAKNIADVANPNSTPILYELRDGKFDRDGAVMYLDGHIDLPKK